MRRIELIDKVYPVLCNRLRDLRIELPQYSRLLLVRSLLSGVFSPPSLILAVLAIR